jgi:dimethylglycine dehydrogenase
MVEGDPGMDVFAMDVARFGDFATRAYANAKVRENYSRRFSITFPNEELAAGRPLRTTPIYDRLKERRAVFGAAFGLEHALWFAPEGAEPHEVPTFRRSNAHEPVGRECRAVRAGVGILEIANYGKHEVTGSGAAAWLDRVLAGRLPDRGRITLSPMLSPKGRLMGDLTVARLGP